MFIITGFVISKFSGPCAIPDGFMEFLCLVMMVQFAHSLCQLFLVFILKEHNLPKGWNPHFFCLLLYPVFPITPDKTQLLCGPVGGMTQWVRGMVATPGNPGWSLRNDSPASFSLSPPCTLTPDPPQKKQYKNAYVNPSV